MQMSKRVLLVSIWMTLLSPLGALAQGGVALVAPEDGAWFLPTDGLRLAWQSMEGADSYRVSVRAWAGPQTDHTTADTSLEVAGLEESHRYRWWVVAYANGDPIASSETWLFSTAYGPPGGAPEPYNPGNGGTVETAPEADSSSVNIGWQAWGGYEVVATQVPTDSLFGFRLQVGPDSLFEEGFAVDTVVACGPGGSTSSCWTYTGVDVGPLPTDRPYFWRVRQMNRSGSGPWSVPWSFAFEVGVVSEPDALAAPPLTITAVYPNPAQDYIKVTYEVGEPGEVSLALYNLLGAEVRRWTLGPRNGGRYTAAFDLTDLAAGAYVISLSAPHGGDSKKVVVVR